MIILIEKRGKALKIFFSLCILVLNIFFLKANEPDSAYIFACGDENGSGLYFAWSIDQNNWHIIGNKHPFLKSDYGRWGSQKRMYNPFLFQAPDGQWHCIWSLNNEDGAVAHTVSSDLIYWKPQSYPVLMPYGNCLKPEISYDAQRSEFRIIWHSEKPEQGVFQSFTSDFNHYSPAAQSNRHENDRIDVIAGKKQRGTMHCVAWAVIEELINSQKLTAYKHFLNSERVAMDSGQFKAPVTIFVSPDIQKKKSISDQLIGIFYEDINYAADGGLYAELVQNRDFEYALSDKEGRDENWNSRTAWSVINADAFLIDTVSPIHPNNKHYAVLQIEKIGVSLVNEGFNGIPIKEGEKYDLSLFSRRRRSKGIKMD